MLKKIAPIFLLLSILFSNYLWADDLQTDRCHVIAGTWQGEARDLHRLFGNGGPWPVTIYFVSEQNQQFMQQDQQLVFGMIDGSAAPGFVAPALSGILLGNCQKNRIENLKFLQKQGIGQCANLSKQPARIDEHQTLSIYVPYSNAMTSTVFYFKLRRIDSAQNAPLGLGISVNNNLHPPLPGRFGTFNINSNIPPCQ